MRPHYSDVMEAPHSTVNKGVVLFVAAMASFLTPFMASSIHIALLSIGREFAMIQSIGREVTCTAPPVARIVHERAACYILIPDILIPSTR